jgi:release factor glutamine methyltransferase
MGLELMAGPGALIPRRETELLGHAALERLRQTGGPGSRPLVIDVCTGSGNLALALAHHDPRCEVLGGDLSAEAVALARANAAYVRLSDRVRFAVGDLFALGAESDRLRGVADLIVCNPPYISTRTVDELPNEIGDHEPRLAFDGGDFGVGVLLRLVREAPDFLKPESWLCFEVGVGQGEHMARRLERSDVYTEIERVRDNAGEVRALVARRRAC